MADAKLFFDPRRNVITAQYSAQAHEITKADVPELVRKGAEVDQSAREMNAALKQQGQ